MSQQARYVVHPSKLWARRASEVVELASTEGAGGQPEQLTEHGRGGAPYRVARPARRRRSGALRPRGARPPRGRRRAAAARRRGTCRMASTSAGLPVRSGRPGSEPTKGTMKEWLVKVVRWSSSPMMSTEAGSSPVSSHASRTRRVGQRLARVLTATGEADLALVGSGVPPSGGSGRRWPRRRRRRAGRGPLTPAPRGPQRGRDRRPSGVQRLADAGDGDGLVVDVRPRRRPTHGAGPDGRGICWAPPRGGGIRHGRAPGRWRGRRQRSRRTRRRRAGRRRLRPVRMRRPRRGAPTAHADRWSSGC